MKHQFLVFVVLAFPGVCLAQKYVLTPGPVIKVSDSPYLISGTFTLEKREAGNDPFVLPDGTKGVAGGACLVFQHATHKKGCDTDSQCDLTDIHAPGSGVRVMPHTGYCVDEGEGQKYCWHKRGESDCLKYPFQALIENQGYPIPAVSGDAYWPPPSKVRWRVLSCQNLRLLGCANGKSGVDFIPLYGPILAPP
jgi:hypothetical protein